MKEEKELEELEELRKREEKRKARVQNAAFLAKNDTISFVVPRGRKEDVKKRAAALGLSVNAYVAGLVLEDVDKNRE